MKGELIRFLKMNDVEYKENLPLAKISPIRIGAEAEAVAYPDDSYKLCSLIGFLEKGKIRYKIAGRMSNLLPPDEKYDGVIIRTDRINSYSICDNSLTVSCGVSLPFVSRLLLDAGLSGFEGLSGIPGSIGGAIVGNAGAFGREIADLITDLFVYDIENDNVIRLSKADCDFRYRHSALKGKPLVVLSAQFAFSPTDPANIKAEMDRCGGVRKSTQPVDKFSLGSAFKRPADNISAARLIDECGLKGYSVGGAMISEKHAGFIINKGGATAGDYIALSDYAANKVYEKFSISLEREVEIM